ncbi:AMP-binding protein, partial [Flavobacterium sp. HMWF030]
MISLFDISLQLNGFPIKKAKTELDKIVNLSEEEHAHFLENKKREIVHFHLKNNSFYQELAKIDSYKNWSDLPILNKRNLQRPLTERLSKGYS